MKKIARIIKKSSSVAIVIHVNPDADCIGSATALALALRMKGKKADIFCDGEVPKRLSFLEIDNFLEENYSTYDVCLAVDVASKEMMGCMREKIYDICAVRCCIDHHVTNKGYADYNYVDGDASAAGEIMYGFIRDYLKCEITGEIAMRLYSAIASDTGSFKYSNTTSKTHLVVSELTKVSFDAPLVMRKLFDTKSISQLQLTADVTSKLKFYFDNKVCVAIVDEEMLSKYELAFSEADDIAVLPRSVAGVEVGIYIKVKAENDCKVSLRSNDYVDVSKIARAYGGGGHIRAAGVSIKDTPDNALRIILDLVEKVI